MKTFLLFFLLLFPLMASEKKQEQKAYTERIVYLEEESDEEDGWCNCNEQPSFKVIREYNKEYLKKQKPAKKPKS